MKKFFHKYLTLFLVGVVIGAAGCIAFAPSILAWGNSTSVACVDAVREAATRMIWVVGIGALVGGVIVMLLGAAFRRKKHPVEKNELDLPSDIQR